MSDYDSISDDDLRHVKREVTKQIEALEIQLRKITRELRRRVRATREGAGE